MTEREEIVRALEICATIHGAGPECEGCPYYPRRGHGCMSTMMRNAAELLRARVLALDELRGGMVVWIEQIDARSAYPAVGGSSAGGSKCFVTVWGLSESYGDAEYNVTWRAWTAEPDGEQRKAVKWHD